MVKIDLTEKQMEILEPEFEKVRKNNEDPRYEGLSIIILQPKVDGFAKGGYIPPKYALKIQSITLEYCEELKEE